MSGKVKAMKEAAKVVKEGVKGKASAAKTGISGAASKATQAVKAGAAASEARGKNIVAEKTVDALKKQLAREASRNTTASTFREGIKSGIGAATESTSRSVTGETIKRAAGRLTDSDYVSTAIKPGLRSAFEQAGGKSGAAKRIIGGAAIGGTTTGTIGALRGNDFWESSRSGAVAGAGIGAGRQIQQMGQTEVGSELMDSVRGEMSTAKNEASVSHGLKEAREFQSNFPDSDTKVQATLMGAKHRANEYQSNSFMGNMLNDMRSARDERMDVFRESAAKAEARGQQEIDKHREKIQKRKSSSGRTPQREEFKPQSNVSNPVRVLERQAVHNQMSNALFGNHQGGRRNTGMRKRMR